MKDLRTEIQTLQKILSQVHKVEKNKKRGLDKYRSVGYESNLFICVNNSLLSLLLLLSSWLEGRALITL